MRIVGRDYIFKLMSQQFLDSMFEVRKRYFLGGMPSEIGRGKTVYFVAKFHRAEIYKQYTLVGEGQVKDVFRIGASDRHYSFATQNGWSFVIDFENLKRYSRDIPAREVFSESILKKLNGQRPFGIELAREESKYVLEKLGFILSNDGLKETQIQSGTS